MFGLSKRDKYLQIKVLQNHWCYNWEPFATSDLAPNCVIQPLRLRDKPLNS